MSWLLTARLHQAMRKERQPPRQAMEAVAVSPQPKKLRRLRDPRQRRVHQMRPSLPAAPRPLAIAALPQRGLNLLLLRATRNNQLLRRRRNPPHRRRVQTLLITRSLQLPSRVRTLQNLKHHHRVRTRRSLLRRSLVRVVLSPQHHPRVRTRRSLLRHRSRARIGQSPHHPHLRPAATGRAHLRLSPAVQKPGLLQPAARPIPAVVQSSRLQPSRNHHARRHATTLPGAMIDR